MFSVCRASPTEETELEWTCDCTPVNVYSLSSTWYDELKLLKGTHVCRSNTHPDMKSHVTERLATDHGMLLRSQLHWKAMM